MKLLHALRVFACASCLMYLSACSGGIALITSELSDSGGGSDAGGGGGGSGGSTPTLAAPANISAVANSHQVTITWDPVSGATSYNVYWNTTSGVTPSDNKITGATSPYTHTDLSNVSTYYYVVTAEGPGISASMSEIEAAAVAGSFDSSADIESDPSDEVSASPEFAAQSSMSIIPSWVVGGEMYGYTGAIDGTTLLVGAPNYQSNAGRAAVYELVDGTWTESTFISSSDAADDDFFASSMSLDGDTVLVGAPGKNAEEGQIYFFTKDIDGTWGEETFIVSEEVGTQLCRFGYSVSISGDTAVIGSLQKIAEGFAPCTDDVVSFVPNAYIFKKSGGVWSQTTTVTGSDEHVNSHDYFGFDVAIKGNTMVIGAPRNSEGVAYKGQAYWYRNVGGTWTEQGILAASDPSIAAYFGAAVAISDDEEKIFIGAPGKDARTGAVYVFENGIETTKLTAPDAQQDKDFGMKLASRGNRVAVAAPSFETVSGMWFAPPDDGSVYLFDINNYEYQLKLTGSDSGGAYFGYDLKMDDYLLVGASGTGEAFIY